MGRTTVLRFIRLLNSRMTRFVEGRTAGSPNRDKNLPIFLGGSKSTKAFGAKYVTSWPKFKRTHSRTEITKIIHAMLTFGVNWPALREVIIFFFCCFSTKLMRSSEVRGALTDVQTPAGVCNVCTVPKPSAQYRCTILLDHISPHV